MQTTTEISANALEKAYNAALSENLVKTNWELTKSVIVNFGLLVLALTLMGASVNIWLVLILYQSALGSWVLYQMKKFIAARYYLYVGISCGFIVILSSFGSASYSYLLLGPYVLTTVSMFGTTKERYGLSLLMLGAAYVLFQGDYHFFGTSDFESPEKYRIVFVLITLFLFFFKTKSFLKVTREFRLSSSGMVHQLKEEEARLQLECLKGEDQSTQLEKMNSELQVEIYNGIRIERDLTSSNEQLEQFAYAASHDLKEPLRSISSFVQLVIREIKDLNDSQINDHSDEIYSSSSQMTRLLDDLLNYSRAGRFKCTSSVIDLDVIAKKVLVSFKSYEENFDAIVNVHALPKVFAGKKCIEYLFGILIKNSYQNRDPSRKLEIEISQGETTSGIVEILVKDNGVGVCADGLEKIFTLFEKGKNSIGNSGSGVGLAIARKTISSFGGDIKMVQNDSGQGVTCVFTLPVATSEMSLLSL